MSTVATSSKFFSTQLTVANVETRLDQTPHNYDTELSNCCSKVDKSDCRSFHYFDLPYWKLHSPTLESPLTIECSQFCGSIEFTIWQHWIASTRGHGSVSEDSLEVVRSNCWQKLDLSGAPGKGTQTDHVNCNPICKCTRFNLLILTYIRWLSVFLSP